MTAVLADEKHREPQFAADRNAASGHVSLETRSADASGDALSRGHRELWSYPECCNPTQLSLAQICDAARAAEEDFSGWPFLFFYENGKEVPYCIEDGIEAVVEFRDFTEQHRANFWQLRQSGFFFQRTPMWEDSFPRTHESKPVMDVREFAIYAALGLRCVTKLYENLFEGSTLVTIGVRVTDSGGRRLQFLDDSTRPLLDDCVAELQEIECVQTCTLAAWKADLVDHAVFVCDHVFQSFSWVTPNLGACRQVIEELLARRRDA